MLIFSEGIELHMAANLIFFLQGGEGTHSKLDNDHCNVYQSLSFKELCVWHSDKQSACNAGHAGDLSLIPGSGRSTGKGNGNPLQYFCLGNPMDRGAWWATVRGVAKESDTTERQSD